MDAKNNLADIWDHLTAKYSQYLVVVGKEIQDLSAVHFYGSLTNTLQRSGMVSTKAECSQDIHLEWRVMYEHHGITQDYMRQHSNTQAVLWRSNRGLWACSKRPGITGGRSGSSWLLRVSGMGQGSSKSYNIGSFGSLVYCARSVLAPGPLLFHQEWLLKDSTASPPGETPWPNSEIFITGEMILPYLGVQLID